MKFRFKTLPQETRNLEGEKKMKRDSRGAAWRMSRSFAEYEKRSAADEAFQFRDFSSRFHCRRFRRHRRLWIIYTSIVGADSRSVASSSGRPRLLSCRFIYHVHTTTRVIYQEPVDDQCHSILLGYTLPANWSWHVSSLSGLSCLMGLQAFARYGKRQSTCGTESTKFH